MKREIMWALTELENALISEGVPEEVAASLVDRFEMAVEKCLEKHQDETEDVDDDAETEDAEVEDSDDDGDGCDEVGDGERSEDGHRVG